MKRLSQGSMPARIELSLPPLHTSSAVYVPSVCSHDYDQHEEGMPSEEAIHWFVLQIVVK